jgi:6-phosphogluconolactonase (cycloisomerase 2 family)
MKSAASNRIIARVVLILALVLGLTKSLQTTFAAPSFVYINANINIAGQNAVIALQNDGSGNLTPVVGSPFATGGTGVAGLGDLLKDIQWDSDGEVAINPAGTLLFAVNGHSNDFSEFSVNADGSLAIVPGSPFPSGGTQPAFFGFQKDRAGNGPMIMVVANKDSDPFQTASAPNFTTFRVDSTGTPTQRSTFGLPTGSSPWQFLFPRKSPYFLTIMFTGDNVSTYELSRAGKIKSTASFLTAVDNGGGVLNPRANTLYVTAPAVRQLNVLSSDDVYNLSLVKTLDSPGKAPCWATTDKAGTRLYISETPSGSVTAYDITNAEDPVEIQHLALRGPSYPTHLRLDPTEQFLYILDRHGRLHILDVGVDGTLTENQNAFELGLPDRTVPPLGLAVLSK